MTVVVSLRIMVRQQSIFKFQCKSLINGEFPWYDTNPSDDSADSADTIDHFSLSYISVTISMDFLVIFKMKPQ